MNNQSTDNNANSLSDLFATGEGVTTNQVSSTVTGGQPNSMVNQVSQNQGVFTAQTSTGINQNSVDVNNMSQPAMPNQAATPNINVVNQSFSNTMDDEAFLKAFIGKNYEKITTRNFNFSAFFFSSLYVLYRKMFWQGLVLYCAMFVSSNLLGSIGKVISLVIALATGLMFNKIYVKYAI